MKRLHGLVLVKETNAGIPNLVVAGYDSEVDFSDLTADPTATTTGLSRQLLARLGKRLGSVLTDQDGRFTMSSDDLGFQGTEARPDLVLAIFAPEDVIDAAHPYPYPPDRRILYISSVSRTDAGAEEVYVIRLPQAQLDQFQLTADTSSPSKRGDLNSTALFNMFENSYGFRDSLRQKMAPRLQAEMATINQFKAMASERLKDFSAIPNSLRAHPLLLKDVNSLKSVQEGVVTAWVKGVTSPSSADLPDAPVDLIRVRGLGELPMQPEELLAKYLKQNAQPKR